MPKPKQFLKENKKKSKHAASVRWLSLRNGRPNIHVRQVPTTADEYLEGTECPEMGWIIPNRAIAGVDFEEAGEKWRGGDAAKVCPLKIIIT
jgi:hypothetical protein